MKREVPMVLTFIFAIIRCGFELIEPMLSWELAPGKTVFSRLSFSITFMTVMGLFMGLINLTRLHVNTIRRRRENWVYSIWLLFVLYGYAIVGLGWGPNGTTFVWIYEAVIVPLDSTMFSMLAFFIASAAYRAFRIRNIEASILLVVAFIVMLGNVSVGEMIWSSSGWLGGFKGVKDWLLAVPNVAHARALAIGIFLGAYAATLRVFLGLDKKYLGGTD